MPGERIKISHPMVVAAWRMVGSEPAAAEAGQRLAEDWHTVGDLLVWMDGHGNCGGWSFEAGTGELLCACGDLLHEAGGVPEGVPA